jgi:hypothetical protein
MSHSVSPASTTSLASMSGSVRETRLSSVSGLPEWNACNHSLEAMSLVPAQRGVDSQVSCRDDIMYSSLRDSHLLLAELLLHKILSRPHLFWVR